MSDHIAGCPLLDGPCCPWMEAKLGKPCDCQCLCDVLAKAWNAALVAAKGAIQEHQYHDSYCLTVHVCDAERSIDSLRRER